MDVILIVVAAMLIAAGTMVGIRLVRGPSTLDRAVALDALVAVLMAGIGIYTATRRIPFYLPVLLVLAFLGFTSSVGVARFLSLRDEAGSEDADDQSDDDNEEPRRTAVPSAPGAGARDSATGPPPDADGTDGHTGTAGSEGNAR